VNEYLLIALGVSFAGAVFSATSTRAHLVHAPALLSLWLLAWATTSRSSRRRLVFLFAAGVVAALLSVVAPPLWIGVLRVGLLGQLAVALLPSWRGVPRDARRSTVEALIFAGVASVPLAVIVFACVLGGEWSTLEALRGDLLEGGVTALAVASLPVLTSVLALDGRRSDGRSPVLLLRILLVATAVILVSRLAWVLSVASNPL
jgi:hypothetical protein